MHVGLLWSNYHFPPRLTSTKHDILDSQVLNVKRTVFWEVELFYPEDGGSIQYSFVSSTEISVIAF
jgi:hypothetical protein